MIRKILAVLIVLTGFPAQDAYPAGGVVNGQPVNAAVTNAAFLFKNANDSSPYQYLFGATGTPAASAQFELQSTTKGFLPPRMTTTQRDAISSPAAGLACFNTTTANPNYYDGSAWRQVASQTAALTASRALVSDGSGFVTSATTTATQIGYLSTLSSNAQTQLDGKASIALNNLASVAVNTSLLPGADNTIDLGSASFRWANAYVGTQFIHVGTQPASVGTTPATAATSPISWTPAVGGSTTIATTGVGGAGAAWSLTMGAGGQSTAATTAATGGAGGSWVSNGGVGGAASVSGSGTNTGGAGGLAEVRGIGGGAASGTSGTARGGNGGQSGARSGAGGVASGTGTNIGGNGGQANIFIGSGGAITAAAATNTGGNGGAVILGGNGTSVGGGAASGATGTNTGGAGGTFTINPSFGAVGGAATGGTAAVGGAGAIVTLNAGLGGAATGASSSNTGGAGGSFTIQGAVGGAASGAGVTNTGGGAGLIQMVGGNGGAASGGSAANVGGVGSYFDFVAGSGGIGSGTGASTGADGYFQWRTQGGTNTRMTLSSAGALSLGATSATTVGGLATSPVVLVDTSQNAGAAGNYSVLVQGTANKERVAIISTAQPVLAGQFMQDSLTAPIAISGAGSQLLDIQGRGSVSSSSAIFAARIQMLSEAAWSSSSAPAYIAFSTAPSGSLTPAERMRIDSSGNVGIGVTPTNILDILKSQNAVTKVLLTNANAGSGAYAQYDVTNDIGRIAGFGAGSSAATANVYASRAYVFADNTNSDGVSLIAAKSTGDMRVFTGGQTAGAERLRVDNGGQVIIQTVGKGLSIKEGSNAKMGTCTLVLGTCTVSTTAVTASSRIFITVQSLGTVAVATPVAVTAKTASTSFVITSASAADTSVVAWFIVEPS